MRNNKGFTLIELVIVIVILAVLAAVAMPKFIDLSSSARISTLEGMKGTLASGTSLIHTKAIINDQLEGAGSISEGGSTITLESGFPTGYWNGSMRYIPGLDDVEFSASNEICTSAWCGKGNQNYIPSGLTAATGTVYGKVFPEGYSYNDECGVYYINNEDGTVPTIGLETDDC